MSQYKDTSLKDLLQSFVHWTCSDYEPEDSAETKLECIAGELNRRIYQLCQPKQWLKITPTVLMHVDGVRFVERLEGKRMSWRYDRNGSAYEDMPDSEKAWDHLCSLAVDLCPDVDAEGEQP